MNIQEFKAYVEASRKASMLEAMSVMSATISDYHEANVSEMGE